MTLYHLSYTFGMYDDRGEWFIGTFPSKEERQLAKEIFLRRAADNPDTYILKQFNMFDNGNFGEWESELGNIDY